MDLKDIFDQGEEENIDAYVNFLDSVELVDLFYLIDEDYYQKILTRLKDTSIADILPYFEKSLLVKITELISDSRLTHILDFMQTDDAAYVLRSMDEHRSHGLIKTLKKANQIARVLSFPEETAGAIMQTEVCVLLVNKTAKECVESIRIQKKQLGDVISAFVIDEDRKLLGIVQLDDLILGNLSDPIQKIMKPLKHYVSPENDQEEVGRLFAKYDLTFVPVVDDKGYLLGQITHDDIQDVMEEEVSEDLLAYVGVSPEESIVDLDQNKLFLAFGRFPWLVFSISASFVTGYILTFFDEQVSNAIVFASFVPLIMNTTGNVGTQTAMITTRSFALGVNELGQFRIPLKREFVVGLLLGTMASCLTAVLIFVVYGDLNLSFRVGTTLIISMTSAAFLGMMIPLFFKGLGIDPAIASGPLVTSFCDMLSVSLYLAVIILTKSLELSYT